MTFLRWSTFFDTFYINADQTGNLLAADTLFMQGDNG